MERQESHQEAKRIQQKKPKVVKQWLSRQAFWQVHLPAPAHIDRPHYQVTIPNEMHQLTYYTCLWIRYMEISINTFKLELMSLPDIKLQDH